MTPTEGGNTPLRFGRYMVKRELGEGGMGLVYLAEDPTIGREVAIKIIRSSEDDNAEFHTHLRKRFEIEIRAAGNLSHPNIVTIYDVGGEDDCSYVAMEYVPGETLESVLLADRTLSFKEVSDLTIQLCRALDYAHENKVVHRDIKPANVLLSLEGVPKIVDFGVAKTLATGSEASTRLTEVGTIIGTPAYMSPEQVTGHDVTPASDQFSLAVIVYEMLAGRLPFQGDGPTTVMYKIVHEDPPALRSFNKRLPGKIDAVVLKALAKEPADRYPTCTDFARTVREVLRAAPHEAELSDAEANAIDMTIVLPTLSDGTDGTIALQSSSAADKTAVLPASADPDAAVMLGSGAMLAGSRPRAILLAALLIVSVSVVATIAFWPEPLPEEPASGPAPAAVPPAELARTTAETVVATQTGQETPGTTAPASSTWWLQVNPLPAGAEIWVEGAYTGLISPAEVQIEGASGDTVRVELRRDGVAITAIDLELGSFMVKRWPIDATPVQAGAATADPAAPATTPRPDTAATGARSGGVVTTMSVTSRPPGARVSIDGTELDGVTPLQVDLNLGTRHSIRLELPGYEPASWAFAEGDLSNIQRDSRTLHFPLTPDTPPGTLRIIAPDYAVVVTIDGRSYSAAARHEIEIPSGSYEVTITAEEVFLSQTRRIDIPADGEREIPLPVALPIQIAATPGNCRVSIDGRFADVTPFRRRVVAGEHEFEFFWPALGRTVQRTERINRANQRIFAALE